jgi:alanyl-tRNA synthetase
VRPGGGGARHRAHGWPARHRRARHPGALRPTRSRRICTNHRRGGYRVALSAAHTACHLAALALDAALATAWSKPAPTNALGNPAFDSLAIQASRISPLHSTDVYRIGKSLRREGFAPSAFDDLPEVADCVNAQLAQWIGAGGAVRVERGDTTLSARRTWVCELPNGRTDIPCGGTHIHTLDQLSVVTTSFLAVDTEGALEVTMKTVASTT